MAAVVAGVVLFASAAAGANGLVPNDPYYAQQWGPQRARHAGALEVHDRRPEHRDRDGRHGRQLLDQGPGGSVRPGLGSRRQRPGLGGHVAGSARHLRLDGNGRTRQQRLGDRRLLLGLQDHAGARVARRQGGEQRGRCRDQVGGRPRGADHHDRLLLGHGGLRGARRGALRPREGRARGRLVGERREHGAPLSGGLSGGALGGRDRRRRPDLLLVDARQLGQAGGAGLRDDHRPDGRVPAPSAARRSRRPSWPGSQDCCCR